MTTPTPRGPSRGRGTVHGDLSQMAGTRPMNGVMYFGVLLVAAGIDIATFYQVLALVMKNVPDEVVWLGVVGFTVTALSLAHTMGVRLRDRIDEGGKALGSASAWLLFVIWLFVGVTAFIVRFVAAEPSTTQGTTIVEEGQQVFAPLAGSDNPLLAALLFLALYLATGTVAAIAGYLRHNTAAKQYSLSLRTRASAARIAASSAADLALAQQTKIALEEERRRRDEGWVKAQEEWHAIARRLKQEARLRLAAAAQNPSTTDAYFAPPPYAGGPISGAPISGMPTGLPSSGVPAPGSGAGAYPVQPYPVQPYPVQPYPVQPYPVQQYPPAPGYPAQADPPGPYSGAPVPTAPPAAQDWRLNSAPGAHRPPLDHGSSAGERWEGGR